MHGVPVCCLAVLLYFTAVTTGWILVFALAALEEELASL
jgi:hypothetical protein